MRFTIQERLSAGAGTRFTFSHEHIFIISHLSAFICTYLLSTAPNWFAFIHQSFYNGINDTEKGELHDLRTNKRKVADP